MKRWKGQYNIFRSRQVGGGELILTVPKYWSPLATDRLLEPLHTNNSSNETKLHLEIPNTRLHFPILHIISLHLPAPVEYEPIISDSPVWRLPGHSLPLHTWLQQHPGQLHCYLLDWTLLHCTLLHGTLLHCTLRYVTILHCTL